MNAVNTWEPIFNFVIVGNKLLYITTKIVR